MLVYDTKGVRAVVYCKHMKKNMLTTLSLSITMISILVIVGFVIARFLQQSSAFTPIVIDNVTVAPFDASATTIQSIDPQKFTEEVATPNTHVQTSDPELVSKSVPFSFVVLADSDNYNTPSGHNDVLEKMLATSAKLSPDFALFTGDLITMTDVSTKKLTALKKLIDSYYQKYYIAFGKHDVECGEPCVLAWQKIFFHQQSLQQSPQNLYHSFDHENVHFVLLSSDYPLKHGVDDAQLIWLEEDLAHTEKDHIIVISHVPPVNFYEESTEECHDMTCDETRRARLQNIFSTYDVDMVISGHEHTFAHKIVADTDYVIAGNVGNGKRHDESLWQNSFLLITVNAAHITLTLYDENGAQILQKQIM